MKTKVIFRKWRSGDKGIIALFPEIPATIDVCYCLSYEHVGQHGSADPGITRSETKLATPEEYQELKKELESIGYDLDIIKRFPKNAYKKRLDILKDWV